MVSINNNQYKNEIPEVFGPIHYLRGINSGRFPNNNALFIDDEIKAVIDPGSDPDELQKIEESNKIEYVFDSHYHYDHIRYNYIFKTAKIYLHEADAQLFQSLDRLAEAIGLPYLFDREAVEQWKTQLSGGPPFFRGMYDVAYGQEWIWSTKRVDGTLKDGMKFDFGECEMKVIHAPGHSHGMCCFVFPRQHAAYVTDYDLTPFGPWYGSLHCSLEDIITSAEELKNLEGITWYLTSHEMGIYKRDDFIQELDKFMAIIPQRDERILKILRKEPRSLEELVKCSIVYKAKHVEDKFTYLWEWLHLEKHIERLLKAGKIEPVGKRFKVI